MADFQDFIRDRKAAALAYCQGNAAPVNALSTDHAPASFFGPDGTAVQGPRAIKEAYSKGAANFGPNGSSEIEMMQAEAGGNIGYWCGLQHAEVEIEGKLTPMILRITELFRLEDDQWKLVHRHADMAKPSGRD